MTLTPHPYGLLQSSSDVETFVVWGTTPIYVWDYDPEAASNWGLAKLDMWPATGAGFDAAYTFGWEPSYEWLIYNAYTETELTANGQILIKLDLISVLSGFQGEFNMGYAPYGAVPDGVWLDLYDYYQFELQDKLSNGMAEKILVNVSIAEDDGAGNPVAGTIQTKPVTFMAYEGYQDYIIWDNFDGGTGGDLEGHSPNVVRTASGDTTPWRDLFWEEGDFDQGYLTQGSVYVSSTGGANPALYVLDSEITDFMFCTDIRYDSIAGGIVGRVQDTANHWLLAVLNPGVTDPVLSLCKVVSGTPTVVATKTLTGFGPLENIPWYAMRLMFDGNDITGQFDVSDPSYTRVTRVPLEVTYTDSTYNTETDCGIWAEGAGVEFRRMTVFPTLPGFDALAPFDTTPFTSTVVDPFTTSQPTLNAYNLVFFNSNSNGQTSAPYHSTVQYYQDADTVVYAEVVDDRCTNFNTGHFIVKYEDVSGDTDRISFNYGTQGADAGVWAQLGGAVINLDATADDPGESLSAVIDVTVALNDTTTSPVAGTEHTKRITMVTSNQP